MSQPQNTALSRARIADKLGICLSGLCLVHCLLTPVVLIALPSLTLVSFESHHIFHEVLLVILPIVALAAFIPGFRRHGDKRVFFWSVPALALMAVAVTVFHDAIWIQAGLTITGSILLIKAHMLNRHLCACCESHPK
ncbi:MAG TPA: MerC domain-containing protein [Bdellovibrionales bacterium]|nr:MerC domain-containing protein [Bdellovibrionales bacterium]